MLEMLEIKQLEPNIAGKREEIVRALAQESSDMRSLQLTAISTADLRLMFELYDCTFFDNWFRDYFKGRIKFSLSGRMTKSAGKTMCPKNIGKIRPEELVMEIRIGVDFFLNYEAHTRANLVCGLPTQNSLSALMLVFEHELCHVLEFLLFGKSSCKGRRFKAMANNVFGHTDSYHKLPLNGQLAGRTLGLRIGDTVSFEYKNRKLTGLLYNIQKRAVVLVQDRYGPLMDKRGVRYTKYYVPLARIEAAAEK